MSEIKKNVRTYFKYSFVNKFQRKFFVLGFIIKKKKKWKEKKENDRCGR